MDIPDTGAVFTLGKSYLAENTQSYFFIKNDPVKRLISGTNQSAVICDSGRLFVWGENQFGQLGIGGGGVANSNENSIEIVTKPTCVKSLKTLGLKVTDAVFGSGWCVILTTTNEIFFTGRNIFSKETKVYKNFEITVTKQNIPIVRKPFRLKEFNGILKESEDNEENFEKLSAGNEHFVLLTSTGRLFGWGSNKSNQLGLPGKELLLPVELSPELKIINFICGPQTTLIQTITNQFFICGSLNDLYYSTFTELQLQFIQENCIYLHISQSNEIFFITEKGNIYRSNESTRQQNLLFQRFYDYDNEENGPVVKILKGTSFFSLLTKNYKLFTTFSESGHHLKTFREISKFKNLRIFDIAVGDKHVLVMGIPRSVKNFDRNRCFFNKIATINTPDLNGNLIGKNENTNKIEKEHENYTEIQENQINDELGNGNNENNNKPGTLNDTIKVEDVNQNEMTKNNENSPSIQKNEQVSPKINGEIEAEKSDETDKSIENSDSKDFEKIKSSPPQESNNNPKPDSAKPKTPQTNKAETNNAQNEEMENSTPQNGNKSPPINKNTSETEKITKETQQQNGEPKSHDATMPNVSQESFKSLKQLLKQESKSSILSNKSNDESPQMKSKTQTPNNTPSNVKSKTPDKIESTENTNNESSKSPATTEIQEKDTKKPSSKQNTSNKSPPVPPTTTTENESPKPIEFKESSPIEQSDDSSPPQKPRKGSGRSIKFDDKSLKSVKSQDRLVRPNTPYPDGTPQTIKRVQSFVDKNDDMIENTSPNLTDSLENIPEMSPQHSASGTRRTSLKYSDRKEKYEEIVRKASAKPAVVVNEKYLRLDDDDEDDEKLEIELKRDDILDQTTVNKIRFINNGVDVTEKIQEISEMKSNNSVKLLANDPFQTNDEKYKKNSLQIIESSSKNPEDESTNDVKDSRDESKLKIMDDDERTTASMNSNKNGNQFDNETDFKNDKENTENTLIEDIQQYHADPQEPNLKETKKKKMQRFINDLKSRGKEMSCRTNQSVRVEGEPPAYTEVDERLDQKTSKVCTIL